MVDDAGQEAYNPMTSYLSLPKEGGCSLLGRMSQRRDLLKEDFGKK